MTLRTRALVRNVFGGFGPVRKSKKLEWSKARAEWKG